MKLYVCQMPSTQFMEKMSFQDWGVDGCLLKLMQVSRNTRLGVYLSPSRFGVCVFFVESGSAPKKNDPPKEKAEGSSFTRNSLLQADEVDRI